LLPYYRFSELAGVSLLVPALDIICLTKHTSLSSGMLKIIF